MLTKKLHRTNRSRNAGVAAPRLTTHALIRRQERFKIRNDELVEQLAAGLYVHLGKQEDGMVHRLFYSRDDGGWGVAIQEKKTGVVVTILTLEYFANCQRKVKPFEKRRAKELVHWNLRCLDFNPATILQTPIFHNEEKLLIAA
jgi:hypothetical protein